MNEKVLRNCLFGAGSICAATAVTMGAMLAVEEYKEHKARKKLKIITEEFEGKKEWIDKYMNGDVIDVKVV